LGTIGPPVVPHQKFSQIMQVQLLNYTFVDKLSSFGGSRDSEYYNLLLAVQNQKTLNCLVDSGPLFKVMTEEKFLATIVIRNYDEALEILRPQY
jgi:hypothetical protein